MKTTHTPGPWTIDNDRSTVCMAGQRVIVGPAPDGAPREVEIANARLIAAAPELLAALRQVAMFYRVAVFGSLAILADSPAMADAVKMASDQISALQKAAIAAIAKVTK